MYATTFAAMAATAAANDKLDFRTAALDACAAALERAGAAGVPETFAEDLRLATRCIGRITGRVGVEDVLDAVFASFCIGK